MATNPVVTSGALTAGLRTTFRDTYQSRYDGLAARLGKVMDLDLPSDKRTEYYAAFESAPYPRRWQRGTDAQSKAFKDFEWNTTNYIWESRVEWFEEDRDDDQTKSMFEQSSQAGRNFATLDERIFYQMILGSTDADLLPAVPNAADGSAIYAAGRFGIVAGNILAGGGVATAAAVRADMWSVLEVFRLMQDTEGQPLWDEDVTNGVIVVTYNVDNEEVFREAFVQARTLDTAGTAGVDLAAAAVTNPLLESGIKFELWPTQRITDNDWFVFATAAPHGVIYKQNRQDLRESIGTRDNSDRARNERIEYVQWDARFGYGASVPYQTVKVNN